MIFTIMMMILVVSFLDWIKLDCVDDRGGYLSVSYLTYAWNFDSLSHTIT